MAILFNECARCGQRGIDLAYVNGKYWHRRCLWFKTYNFNKAVVFCLINQDDFADEFPDSFNLFWDMLATGQKMWIEAMEVFVSSRIEEYAEWVFSDPEIMPFEEICRRAKLL